MIQEGGIHDTQVTWHCQLMETTGQTMREGHAEDFHQTARSPEHLKRNAVGDAW